jgi:hypothetical protein
MTDSAKLLEFDGLLGNPEELIRPIFEFRRSNQRRYGDQRGAEALCGRRAFEREVAEIRL